MEENLGTATKKPKPTVRVEYADGTKYRYLNDEHINPKEHLIEPPKQEDTVIKAIEDVKIIIDNGGIKGAIVKFLLWFILPLVIFATIAYFMYTSFFGKKANITTKKAKNDSVSYKDEKTDWNIVVTDIDNKENVDNDIKRFEEISKKVKGLYIK